MVKASDITVDDERDYVTATSPDDMELPLESAGRLDLLHSGGHLLIECSDGDLTGVWYSADSVPSEQSDYEELFP